LPASNEYLICVQILATNSAKGKRGLKLRE
jgi:hypothetical protein